MADELSPSRLSESVGDTQIVLYLHAVTDAQIDALMDACADAIVAQGLSCDDGDSPVLALIGLRPSEFPDLEGENAKRFLDEHAQFIIPSANGPNSRRTTMAERPLAEARGAVPK